MLPDPNSQQSDPNTQHSDSNLQHSDPNGPPMPSTLGQKVALSAAGTMLTVIVGGAAAVLLLGVVARPTSGARHSYRLQWQQRQNEVSQLQSQTQDETCRPSSDAEQVHE
jgi:hypothetical protein